MGIDLPATGKGDRIVEAPGPGHYRSRAPVLICFSLVLVFTQLLVACSRMIPDRSIWKPALQNREIPAGDAFANVAASLHEGGIGRAGIGMPTDVEIFLL
jgi:hypothetical protein